MKLLIPDDIAAYYRERVKAEIDQAQANITIVGLLASDDPASKTYAKYTKNGCEDVGITFDLRVVTPKEITHCIKNVNADGCIHGIIVYYPIFSAEEDFKLKEMVDPKKDVEGLTQYWADKLYANQRFDDVEKKYKSILPCTPLAILKLLEATSAYAEYGLPFQGKTITVFNRSDVVGKPLAYMLANDGAKVFSFDIDGGVQVTSNEGKEGSTPTIERDKALRQSDVVITGVPSKRFMKVKSSELRNKPICLNFSTIQNFEEDAKEFASVYIPRVGSLTVAMCLRNAVRLFKNYHKRIDCHHLDKSL